MSNLLRKTICKYLKMLHFFFTFHIEMCFTWFYTIWQHYLLCDSSQKDGEEVTAQEANKKKNKKKKTQDSNTSEIQSPTAIAESKSKEKPLQTRTFANGMIIQEMALGKPDGKKATNGKKVNIFGFSGASSYHFTIVTSQ